MKIATERVWRGRQSWNLESAVHVQVVGARLEIGAVPEIKRVIFRAYVQRDSVDYQSDAKIETWSGTGWSYVCSIPIMQTPAAKLSYSERSDEIAETALRDTRSLLVLEALSTLGLHLR